jgi:hypothetical protein
VVPITDDGQKSKADGSAVDQAVQDDKISSIRKSLSGAALHASKMAAEAKEGLKTRAIEAGKMALAGAGVAVASSLAVKGLKAAAKTKGVGILRPLGKGNIAANLVDAGITVGHEGYKLYKGETTKLEMAHACAEKGAGMLGSAGGASIGAMAALALALPTGGASIVVGGASMIAGFAAPRAYKAGRKIVSDLVERTDRSVADEKGHDAIDGKTNRKPKG